MKAMILKELSPIEKEPLKLVDIPMPKIGPKDILIKNTVCGVCHTDLHTVEGDITPRKMPIIPGHEIVGEVHKIGDSATRFKIGDKVGVAWLNSTCGECNFCKNRLENLCASAKFTGYDKDGGYAEYTAISEDFAYPIPENFDDIQASPLLCAGIIGYRAYKLSDAGPNKKLGLYGFGASAHITIQIAKYIGCEVYVFTRSENHKELARELGAIWTGFAEDTPPALMDSSIIFAPTGRLIPEALRVLNKGGTLALAGIYMSPIPEMKYDLLYNEKTIRSVANSTRIDAEELLKYAVDIPIKTEVDVFPLEEANKVLKLLKDSKIKGSAVLKIS